MNSVIRSEIYALRNNARIAYVGSVSEEGFPQIKGMLVLEHAGMQTHYFSTNTSSKRVGQFLKNPKASVYYCDDTKDKYKGALFTGTMKYVPTTRQRRLYGETALKYTTPKAWMTRITAFISSRPKPSTTIMA